MTSPPRQPGPLSAEVDGRGIEERLAAIVRDCSGACGFFARDLRGGRTIALAADAPFPTASLIKVAILVELERQVVAGDLSMAQALELRDADRVGGSSLLRHLS